MTGEKEFSLEISVNPTSNFKPLPDYVAFDLCKAYPISDGNLLLHNTRNGKRALVRPEVYASLLSCNEAHTVDEHVARIIESNPDMQGQEADIRKVLQHMLKSGIMLSAKKVCDRFTSKSELNPETADTPVVVINTWERPRDLERLLKSIASNCDTKSFHCLYVVDDSKTTESISENKAIVMRLAAGIQSPFKYFGRDQQDALMNDLSKRLPEHEDAIRFLIDHNKWRNHWTSGLSRNLALLLSCGHRLVMIDDDTICEVYDAPQQKPNISFSDQPREADFFDNEKEWAHLRQPLNPDPVKRHMQCLGMSFSEALNTLGPTHLKPASFKKATALEISELQPDSPVLMTECGSLGCPGTENNTWLPDIASESLKKMLASKVKTTLSLTRRKVWLGRNNPHFAPRSNMSQITGFDNREMLPPYLPIERGEDRLFGNLLDFIFPSGLTLDYPWAIPHLPRPERKWRAKDLDFTPADSFPMFFVAAILKHKSYCLSASTLDRYLNLSAWFNNLAKAPAESLAAIYRDTRLSDGSQLLLQLNDLLSKSDSTPVDWQNYLRNGIRQINVDLDKSSRADAPVKGLPVTLQGEELINFWKDVWAGFAAALNAWPEIRKAATEVIRV